MNRIAEELKSAQKTQQIRERDLLARLVRRGELVRVGERKGAFYKLDFIHLVIEPRQLPPSAVIYGKSFWRSGRNGDMQNHSLIENQGLIS